MEASDSFALHNHCCEIMQANFFQQNDRVALNIEVRMGLTDHGQFVEILCYGQTEKDGVDLGVGDNFASITGLIVLLAGSYS